MLMHEDAPQRDYPLRQVFNGVRWIVRTASPWRLMPHDLPPWTVVDQPTQRWINAGVFEVMVQDLRALVRSAKGRAEQPSAAIFDGRTLQSTPESGERAGYDGHKRKKESKVHLAVDTLGHLLALHITPANEQERAQVKHLAEKVPTVTGDSVQVAFVNQGYTGDQAASIALTVVKLPKAKKGFGLFPRRWVVERSFAWTARFRRLARDFERTPEILGRLFLAFIMLMLPQFIKTLAYLL